MPGDSAETRLAVYGTLAPGRENHHQLSGLSGRWRAGTLRGRLVPVHLGEHVGLVGLVLDPDGRLVPAQVFSSTDLPAHWARLDAFEGAAFARVVTEVGTDAGTVAASVYVLRDPSQG